MFRVKDSDLLTSLGIPDSDPAVVTPDDHLAGVGTCGKRRGMNPPDPDAVDLVSCRDVPQAQFRIERIAVEHCKRV